MSPSNVIYLVDRCHLTELAYTIEHCREVTYTAEEIFDIDEILAVAGAFTVFFTASKEVIAQRFAETGKEPDGDTESLAEIFEELLASTSIHTAYIDTTDFGLQDTIDFVTSILLYQLSLSKEANKNAEDSCRN